MRRGNDDENVAGAERATVVYRVISELRPDPRNPRVHRPSQIRQIARSIEEFGFREARSRRPQSALENALQVDSCFAVRLDVAKLNLML